MELIRLESICKTYYLGEVEVPVLRGISLSIHQGEMVALMGASGSGKSTLMNILGCLDHATAGEYWLDGREMSKLTPNERALVRTEKLGFVFQSFNLLSRTSAIQNVIMPLDYSLRRQSGGEARRLAQSLLDRVGLSSRVHHVPSQMSGGQQQRVAISRALINTPALVLADEPTGNLDSHTSVEILRMFQQLNAEGITVLLVTHDPQVAAYAHRTIRIVDGMIEGDDASHPGTGAISAVSPPHTGQTALISHASMPGHSDGNNTSRNGISTAVSILPHDTTLAVAVAAVNHPESFSATERSHPAQPPSCDCDDEEPTKTRRWIAIRPLPATWRTALSALRRNKMRAGLSALGVIIAVAAVIAMTEIGQGSKATLQRSIASMGANTIMIFAGSTNTGGVNKGAGSAVTLTPQDAQEIARQCPAVKAVAPLVRARSQIVYGNKNCVPESIYGTTPSYLEVRDWKKMAAGAMFSDRDVRNSNKVCVIGNTIKQNLFPKVSPIGKEIRINNVAFRVIGVLSRKGANMVGMDQDNIVLAPWTTVKYRVSGTTLTNTNQSTSAGDSSSSTSDTVNTLSGLYPSVTSLYLSRTSTQEADTPQPVRFTNVDQIVVKAVSENKIKMAMTQITDLLRERHRIREGDEEDFSIRDMAEMMKMMSSTTQLMSSLLLVVAMISLVVGGVGIMNIMLVSVTERTREIGLRMAVGARSHHILRQFLVEAVVLCLVGGAIGIMLGRGASLLVRWMVHWPIQASLATIVAAVAVSVGVGVVFGFYPAWKASRLDPIEALRYE
jgi:ABC-type lipoprotein export system ATPase subunit/ABC-type antimicrobial peptide transport system permease subunit